MKRIHFYIFTIILSILTFTSCQWFSYNQLENGLAENIKVHRFDKLQDEFFVQNSFSALQKMSTEYPQETRFLIEDVLAIGSVSDDDINLKMREYYNDTLLQRLCHDALAKFSDMSSFEQEFSRGFHRLKKELPQIAIPRVYAQLSALNQSVIVGDSILGFSIDKYMGEDYPIYDHFYHPHQRKSMSPEHIVPDCFIFYLLSEYPFPWEWHRSLLDHIIHRGKIRWVVAQILEYEDIDRIIGYTAEEKEWCYKHQDEIWNYLIQTGHLHSTDPMLIRTYLHPAEYTYPFGTDSPSEIGLWLGLHVIDEYMKRNEEISIADLLRETDYRGILKQLKNNH